MTDGSVEPLGTKNEEIFEFVEPAFTRQSIPADEINCVSILFFAGHATDTCLGEKWFRGKDREHNILYLGFILLFQKGHISAL